MRDINIYILGCNVRFIFLNEVKKNSKVFWRVKYCGKFRFNILIVWRFFIIKSLNRNLKLDFFMYNFMEVKILILRV